MIDLDPSLIEKFRARVNKRSFFDKYRNVNGKNLWNITCSAMDWISVAVDGIPLIKLERGGLGPDHHQTLNLMTYIVAIDNLYESIRQLYRVLFGSDWYPLLQDKSVFQQSEISDDVYFKQIRAVFATHPVQLHSADGRPHNGDKFYASWASSGIGREDFTVFLYNGNADAEDTAIPFGVSISKVNRYAEMRYCLLNPLGYKVNDLIHS